MLQYYNRKVVWSMCGPGHVGVRVRLRPQILHPRPQESVDKHPRPHMSVNGMRGTAWMLNIQVQISGDRGAVWKIVLNITLLMKWRQTKSRFQ